MSDEGIRLTKAEVSLIVSALSFHEVAAWPSANQEAWARLVSRLQRFEAKQFFSDLDKGGG